MRKYGTQPYVTELPTLDTNHADFVAISCQITLPADQDPEYINDYSPRLRFYLTTDGKVCTLRPQNHSHPCTDHHDTCAGFNYIYYEEGTKTINFTFHVFPIARMNNSVITCGVHYRGNDSYTQSALMISIQDGPTCSPFTTTELPTMMTNATTKTTESTTTEFQTTTEPPTESSTTTKPPTITPLSTTQNNTKIPNTETPTIPAIACDTPKSTAKAISMKEDTFFSAVGIVILVGIILLLGNFIQLWVIIKNRRAAAMPAVDLPDEHGEQNDITYRIETEQCGIELEEVLENSMAKESG